MNLDINTRVLKEAEYMLETKKTVRQIAEVFKVSKSTVHKDLKERLEKLDAKLYQQVSLVLNEHYQERHIRGGEVTRQRYRKKREL